MYTTIHYQLSRVITSEDSARQHYTGTHWLAHARRSNSALNTLPYTSRVCTSYSLSVSIHSIGGMSCIWYWVALLTSWTVRSLKIFAILWCWQTSFIRVPPSIDEGPGKTWENIRSCLHIRENIGRSIANFPFHLEYPHFGHSLHKFSLLFGKFPVYRSSACMTAVRLRCQSHCQNPL